MKKAKSATKDIAAKKNGETQDAARPQDAAKLLKADHRKVEQIFAQYEQSDDDGQKRELAQQICLELIVHTRLEEEIFYPACRDKQVEDDLLDEAQVEHDGAKVLIADLLQPQPGDQFYDAKVKTLSEYIRHHVAEEEKPRSGIFAKAQKAGVEMAELGEQLQRRKTELMGQSEALCSTPPQPRSINLQPQKETGMARNSNDRDERGRFTNDDDDSNGRGSSRGGNGNRDRDDQGRFMSDDDNRASSRGGSSQSRGGNGNRDRDVQGRFTSDDERGGSRGGYSQSRGGYDDERGGRSGNQGGGRGGSQGGRGDDGRGWYGDSEGHSQAAREGWENRGSSRSRGYDDDDRGGRGQGGNQGGNQGGSQGGGRGGSQGGRGGDGRGWYGDSEGHSEASRRGWENSDHEGSGWYGDSRGHSQAAREGWEDRGSSPSSRGRDDDDDRGGSRSRSGGGGGRGQGSNQGHGGWFGDSEGHSRAAREGWRDR